MQSVNCYHAIHIHSKGESEWKKMLGNADLLCCYVS